MGCCPYFAATGIHPILPLDIAEATYLVPPPDAFMDMTQLTASQVMALQKRCEQLQLICSRVYCMRVHAAQRFEDLHQASFQDCVFDPGDLVLVRNMAIEKALNRKMRPCYLGPLIVLT